MHRRIRVYLLVPDRNSKREGVDLNTLLDEEMGKIKHILDHPMYGHAATKFIKEDVNRNFLDPPELPDLPLGFSEKLAEFHNNVVKSLYRFSSSSKDKSFMVRVPLDEAGINAEIEEFFGEGNKSFDDAVKLVSKVIELGLALGYEVWPKDVILDLRKRFIEAGIDPRELDEYYSYKRTA